MIRLFENRLEVQNPGGLPGALTLEEVTERGGFSYPRNPILARVMRNWGRMEEVASDAFVEPASLLKPGQMLFLWFMPAEHPEQAEGRIEGCEAHRQTSCNRTLRYALTLFALLRVLNHRKR